MDISKTDRAAIEQLFQDMYAAWADNDAARYAACFEPDVDYIAFDGTHVKGQADNARLHHALFTGILKGTRLAGQPPQLRALSDDVVLAHATGAVVFPWQREIAKGRHSIQTLVLVKRDGRWLAAAFQNTRVKPMPAPEAGSVIVRMFGAYAAVRRALSQATS